MKDAPASNDLRVGLAMAERGLSVEIRPVEHYFAAVAGARPLKNVREISGKSKHDLDNPTAPLDHRSGGPIRRDAGIAAAIRRDPPWHRGMAGDQALSYSTSPLAKLGRTPSNIACCLPRYL